MSATLSSLSVNFSLEGEGLGGLSNNTGDGGSHSGDGAGSAAAAEPAADAYATTQLVLEYTPAGSRETDSLVDDNVMPPPGVAREFRLLAFRLAARDGSSGPKVNVFLTDGGQVFKGTFDRRAIGGSVAFDDRKFMTEMWKALVDRDHHGKLNAVKSEMDGVEYGFTLEGSSTSDDFTLCLVVHLRIVTDFIASWQTLGRVKLQRDPRPQEALLHWLGQLSEWIRHAESQRDEKDAELGASEQRVREYQERYEKVVADAQGEREELLSAGRALVNSRTTKLIELRAAVERLEARAAEAEARASAAEARANALEGVQHGAARGAASGAGDDGAAGGAGAALSDAASMSSDAGSRTDDTGPMDSHDSSSDEESGAGAGRPAVAHPGANVVDGDSLLEDVQPPAPPLKRVQLRP